MSLNVEGSVLLDQNTTRVMGFKWHDVAASLLQQPWDIYRPELTMPSAPAWRLLYDEYEREIVLDESEETTLLVRLSHSDTARIQAEPGTDASRGTQYFWLSRDCYGFFPPLTIRNQRGTKATFSCLVRMRYVDIGVVENDCRVTFEAENNLDFRLGTGPLRGTRAAGKGDIAAISRVSDKDYELSIIRQGTANYLTLKPFLINFIGHRGKQYGYIDNNQFAQIMGLQLPAIKRAPA